MYIPDLDSDGVLWLETEAGGLLSDPSAVILCRDLDVVEDIQRMEDSVLLRQMPHQEVEYLLVDIGMLLQYVASTDADNNAPPVGMRIFKFYSSLHQLDKVSSAQQG